MVLYVNQNQQNGATMAKRSWFPMRMRRMEQRLCWLWQQCSTWCMYRKARGRTKWWTLNVNFFLLDRVRTNARTLHNKVNKKNLSNFKFNWQLSKELVTPFLALRIQNTIDLSEKYCEQDEACNWFWQWEWASEKEKRWCGTGKVCPVHWQCSLFWTKQFEPQVAVNMQGLWKFCVHNLWRVLLFYVWKMWKCIKLDAFSLLKWVFLHNITHSMDELLNFSGLFLAISYLFPVRKWKIYFILSQISNGNTFILSGVRICDLGTKWNCFVHFFS